MTSILRITGLVLILALAICKGYGQEIQPQRPVEIKPYLPGVNFLPYNPGQNQSPLNGYKLELPKDTLLFSLSFEEFKKKFLALRIAETIPDLHLPVPQTGIPKLLDEKYISSLGFALNHPISFFYYNFNKKEQSKRKIIFLNREDQKYAAAYKKYNPKKVQEWTGLKGTNLDRFMTYCNFSSDFILSATEYEIILLVKKKLQEFKKSAFFRSVPDQTCDA
jgi:hypothetical protein